MFACVVADVGVVAGREDGGFDRPEATKERRMILEREATPLSPSSIITPRKVRDITHLQLEDCKHTKYQNGKRNKTVEPATIEEILDGKWRERLQDTGQGA